MALTKITGNEIQSGSITPSSLNVEGGFSFRNKIINGDMRIDQRNAGAAVTITGSNASTYVLDRFYARAASDTGSKISVQRSTVAPAGFNNSLLITSLTSYTPGVSDTFGIIQAIEGFNIGDLGWGTVDAQPITLSFKVRSSLTGTFGGFIANKTVDRCYLFSYTINSANTFEDKTITIPGDVTGTWLTNNDVGLFVSFSVGVGSNQTGSAGSWSSTFLRSVTGQTSLVGTNGATWYITGVQLEVGSVATPFEQRQIATEFNLCTRYFYRMGNGINNYLRYATGEARLTTEINGVMYLPNVLRVTPTLSISSASHFAVAEANVNRTLTSLGISTMPQNCSWIFFTASVASGLTAGRCGQLISNNTQSSYMDFSAEL